MNALKSYLGQEDTGVPAAAPDATTGAASAMLDVANQGIFNQGVETETPELAASSGADGTLKNPIAASAPPAGAIDKGYSKSQGGKLYYVPNNPQRPDLGGKYYVVKGAA